MGFRREIKLRFLIIMVVAIVLGGCLFSKMLQSHQDPAEDYTRDKSGTCLAKPMWVQEHISKSPMKHWINSPSELNPGRHDWDLNFHVSRVLKYVFLDGLGDIIKLDEEQLDKVLVHQVSRRQQDTQPDWTYKPLENNFGSRMFLMVLVIILLHSSALPAMIHQVKSTTRKRSLGSEKWNNTVDKGLEDLYSACTYFDKMSHSVANCQSKDRAKKPWMVDPLRWDRHFIEYTTYSVLERVASYRPFAFDLTPNIPSAVTLAEAGFQYPGEGSAVQCQGCRSYVEIGAFNSPATEAKYHREGCFFVTASNNDTEEMPSSLTLTEVGERATANASYTRTEQASSKVNATRATPLGTLPSTTMANNQLNSQPVGECKATEAPHNCLEATAKPNLSFANVAGNENDFAEPPEQNSQQTVAAGNMTRISTASWECEQIGQIPAVPQHQTNESITRSHEQIGQVSADPQQQTNETGTMGHEHIPVDHREQGNALSETRGASANPGVSDQLTDPDMASAFTRLLFDPSAFDAEEEILPLGHHDLRERCQKNPGHFGNFPMAQLQLNHIPSNVRCPEVLEFFQLIGKLVVKLTIRKRSSNRPQFGESIETHAQCGTGLAFAEDDSDDPAPTEPTRRWSTIRRYIPGLKKNKGIIHIRTSCHVIFDDFEAENTLVEFFYDNPNGNEIVKAKGVSVTHSPAIGDATSVLKCTISDLSMVEFVKNTEKQVRELVARLPTRIKENLTKRVFVISHPHGLEKVFSYGEYAVVKYALKPEKRNGVPAPEIVKINNHTQISENSNSIRKMLFYTADTCKGSSGGLVVSFKKTGLNGTEDIQLDLWIHSCVEKKHGLNASVMKELTPDDIINHGNTSITRPSVQDEQESEADAASRQIVTGPVYTVMEPPAHPVYVPYMKRLGSYPNPFSHVHTAADLADAGFFFAGYADCVRCFQCGLGLRSWKAGDSIYEEHHRNRPDCQFLQMKMRANGITRPGRQSGRQHSNSRTPAQAPIIQQPERKSHQTRQSQLPLASTETSEPASEETNQTKLLKPSSSSLSAAQNEPSSVSTSQGSNTDDDSTEVPKSTAVNVLEREQKYLKQLFTCKICFEKPVKDLFLPCGELVACLECSKLLTHCPSCNKKILATVTTYFS
ncbi:unnamed protein product [Candidula unifasciata]|uniref:RING-type domain-containing protein n=1 Tax=Candidula unifasciata TaxID=100452 RepID=A0A8S3ZPN0_9EUPU|nr:unnamed protein product [Candidula unifasciata]